MPFINLAQDTVLSCGQDSLQLDAGAGFASYQWNTGDTVQSPFVALSGMYYVTVTNGAGCEASDSVYVSLINAEIAQDDTTICAGETIEIKLENHLESDLSAGDSVGGGYFVYRLGPYNHNYSVFYETSLIIYYDTIGNSQWGAYGASVGTNSQVGFGKSNTENIIQFHDSINYSNTYSNYHFLNNGTVAAYLCDTFYGSGYGDWFLPSREELSKATDNQLIIPGSFYGWLWTSSELNSAIAYNKDINNLTFGSDPKTKSNPVRPFRYHKARNSISSIQWSTGDTTGSINVTPTQTTTYYVTISDGVGSCTDSVTVTINNSNTGTDTQTACDSYTWIDGITYTASTSSPTFTLTNAAGCDSVITLSLTINNSSASSSAVTACDSYTWLQNNVTYTTSGAYTDTIANTVGCDSVISLQLTIDTVDLSITNINDSLVSNDANATTYQWVNCDSNNAIISGATNQGYQPTMSGNYAVILTKGACTDTSACENVIISNTTESKLNANFSLYPNPTRGTVYLELSNNLERGSIIQIYTLTGQLVIEVQIQHKKTLIDISQLERSVYFFKYGNTTRKIVLTN